MATTPTTAQLAILRLNQTIFGKAAGTDTLNAALPQFPGVDDDAEANAYAQALIDDAFAGSEPLDIFKAVLDNVSASNISQADKDALAAEMVNFVNAGLTVGETTNLLSAYLYNSAGTLPEYEGAANPWNATSQLVVNQTAVAVDYAVEKKTAADNSDILDGVTEDPKTVDNAINPPVPGATFTLTKGDDMLIGTSNDDLFTGDNTTYQTGDMIIDTNADDNDTLKLTTTANIAVTPTVSGVENIEIDVAKVGLFTFAATGITGAKNFTVNRGDLMDGAIDGTGAVSISNAKAATFNAGDKVTDFTVDFSTTGNATAAAVVNAGTGAVTVTEVGKGGVTVNGAAGKDISVAETTAKTGTKATINSSGTVKLTSDIDELTLQGNNAAATYDLQAGFAAADKIVVAGDSDITIKATGAILNSKKLVNDATAKITVEATAANDMDLTDFGKVTSVVLGADFTSGAASRITVNADQLITTKTNQTTNALTILNSVTTGNGAARFAVLDNGNAKNAVTAATLTFGDGTNDFDSVYLDATADKFSVTAALDVKGAALVLTGTQDISIADVQNAESITSASTANVKLKSTGNSGDQAIALGAGNDEVEVDDGSTVFVANLGNGDNKLTITNAKHESQFVTGSGKDSVLLTNVTKVVSNGKVTISTGAGDDTITIDGAGNVTDLTIAAGEGTDTLAIAADFDVSALTAASITGVEIIDVGANKLTLNAEQFGKLGAFELKGSGTLEVKDTANKGATIDASVVSLAFGTAAHTELTGGTGDDTITGTIGVDVMTGGTGKDTFVFSSGSGNTSSIIDEVVDFVTATDKLKLGKAGSATNFAELDVDSGATDQLASAADALTAANTSFGGANAGKNFLFLFDSNSGVNGWLAIDWDADGTTDQLVQLTGLKASGDVVATDIIA